MSNIQRYESKLMPLFATNPAATRAEVLPIIAELAIRVTKIDALTFAATFNRLGVSPEDVEQTGVVFPSQFPKDPEHLPAVPSRLQAIELLILITLGDLLPAIRAAESPQEIEAAFLVMKQAIYAFNIDADEASIASRRAVKFAMAKILEAGDADTFFACVDELAKTGDPEVMLPPSVWAKMKES